METTPINSIQILKSKFYLLFIGLTFAFLVSCNNEDTTPNFYSEDMEDASMNAVEDSYFDDGDDLVSEAFTSSDQDLSGGWVRSEWNTIGIKLSFSYV
ncbi:MAG: hypothetical protein IPJ20_20325 [Flammeovirgaceae bacterium]|nr:hypothetical protein [Flammeovirgaceae bacterium]